MNSSGIIETVNVVKEMIEEREKEFERFVSIGTVKAWVDEIDEVLNSMKCENCKHYINRNGKTVCEKVEFSEFDGGYFMPPKDFWCKYFKRR